MQRPAGQSTTIQSKAVKKVVQIIKAVQVEVVGLAVQIKAIRKASQVKAVTQAVQSKATSQAAAVQRKAILTTAGKS